MSFDSSARRRAAMILAPAACIIIAFGVLLMPGQKSAFANAIEYLRHASTIVCKISVPSGTELHGVEINAEGTMHISAEHGTHTEMYAMGMLVQHQYTPLEGPTLMVSPPARSYFELDISEFALQDETVARSPQTWLEQIKKLEVEADTELGRDVIDGEPVVGFKVDGRKLGFESPQGKDASEAAMEIWVNELTQRPARIVVHVPMPGAQKPMSVVMDQFEWDKPLDAAIFEPDIPDDYVKLDVKFRTPSEETLLYALEKIGELSGGRYTSSLQTVTTISELAEMLSDEARAEIAGKGEQGMMQTALEVASGCAYYMKLVRQGSEPEYFGKTVTADDADEVLLRWRLDDGNMRVIYGDLHVETVPAAER
jgi:hypothetical protein